MSTNLFTYSLLRNYDSNLSTIDSKSSESIHNRVVEKNTLDLPHPECIDMSPKQYAINPGLLKKLPARTIKLRVRFLIVYKLSECRLLRAIDVAAYVFGDRPLSAALTAAQRALRGLKNDGLIKGFVSDRNQHFYVLTKAGATWFNNLFYQDDLEVDDSFKARSSTQWAGSLTNPEHLMYSNFIKLCCMSRGLDACVENELVLYTTQRNTTPSDKDSLGLMEVKSAKGGKKLLRPDVLSYNEQGAVWFEIDKSARGSDRRRDLTQLICSVGHRLSRNVGWLVEEQQVLNHLVIFTYSKSFFNTASRLLRKSFPDNDFIEDDNREFNIKRQSVCFIDNETHQVYELWEKRLDFTDKNAGKRHFKGYVSIQMIPSWLKGAGKKALLNAQEWLLSANYLPYVNPDGWDSPKNIIHPGIFKWEDYGLA